MNEIKAQFSQLILIRNRTMQDENVTSSKNYKYDYYFQDIYYWKNNTSNSFSKF